MLCMRIMVEWGRNKREYRGNSMYTEEELLEMLREDGERGLRILMEEYTSLLHSVCGEKLQNKEDIEECVNDVFAEFFLKKDSYDSDKGSLKNYLCMIAERRAIDRYRKNCQKEKCEQELLAKYQIDLETQDDTAEKKEKVEAAMQQLSESDRQILRMHYYDGLSYGEIAEELDIKYETVKKRGLRGKQKLLYLILLGLLLFGITACTTIVMKTYDILPEWVPFYDWIPSVSKEEIREEDDEVQIIPSRKPQKQTMIRENETEETEEETTDISRKYQYADGYGFLWSGEPTYGFSGESGNQNGVEQQNMRFAIEKALFSEGELSIDVRLTLLEGNDEEKLEKMLQNKSTFLSLDGEQISMTNESWRLVEENETSRAYICTFTGTWNLSEKDVDKIQGKMIINIEETVALELEMSKLEIKEETSSDVVELTYGDVKLKKGPSDWSSRYAIVSLMQEDIRDYTISNLIGNSYYGLPGKVIQYPYLTDVEGKQYTMMRTSAKDVIDGVCIARSFEIYYPGVEAGTYKLHIPYLCLEGNTETGQKELVLPTGENDYQSYDEKILFPNGEGFHLKGLTRSEETEQIYHVSADGTLEIENVHYWYYEMEYTTISKEGLEFYNARSQGSASSGENVLLITKTKEEGMYSLCFRVQCDEMPTSMEVYFYNPVYILEEETSFDITIDKTE